MNKIIWYKLSSIVDLQIILKNGDDLSIMKFEYNNQNQFQDVIQQCINLFNSEIEWNDMWNINQSKLRFENGHILYVLIKNNFPLGYVWVDETYLYNTFVSKLREDGDSHWFLQNVIIERFKDGVQFIELYTEEWNKRSIRFWEKIGFKRE
jgi:hypothetical protein